MRDLLLAGDDVRRDDLQPVIDERLPATHAVDQFERAAPEDEGFGFIAASGGFFDDAHRHAKPRELSGHRETDRAGADDENLKGHGVLQNSKAPK